MRLHLHLWSEMLLRQVCLCITGYLLLNLAAGALFGIERMWRGFCDHRFRIKMQDCAHWLNSLQVKVLFKRQQPLSAVILALILLFNIGFLYAAFDMVAYRLRLHYAEEKNKLVWITFCMRGYATAAPPCLMDVFWQQSVTKYWILLQNYTDCWWLKKSKNRCFLSIYFSI